MVRRATAYQPIGFLLLLALMGLALGTMALHLSPAGVVTAAAETNEETTGEWLLIRVRSDSTQHPPASACMVALLSGDTGAPRAAVLTTDEGQTAEACLN